MDLPTYFFLNKVSADLYKVYCTKNIKYEIFIFLEVVWKNCKIFCGFPEWNEIEVINEWQKGVRFWDSCGNETMRSDYMNRTDRRNF